MKWLFLKTKKYFITNIWNFVCKRNFDIVAQFCSKSWPDLNIYYGYISFDSILTFNWHVAVTRETSNAWIPFVPKGRHLVFTL